MLALHAHGCDDSAFLDTAATLIAGAAMDNGVSDVWAIHIDNWFGQRWLGFRGKAVGAVGFRNRELTTQLFYPPFHPHRVLSEKHFVVLGRCDFRASDMGIHEIHKNQKSSDNLRRKMSIPGLYAWYSGNTIHTDKAAIMVYVVADGRFAAWYAMFQKNSSWQFAGAVGISRSKCFSFIERGTVAAVP